MEACILFWLIQRKIYKKWTNNKTQKLRTYVLDEDYAYNFQMFKL
jgi:hypothetical protein